MKIRPSSILQAILLFIILFTASALFAQDSPPPATDGSVPYLNEALKLNETLLGLPALPLVLLGALAFGYVLKFIPKYPNDWIPIGVIVGALAANVGIVISEGSGDFIRATILGIVAGVASIAIHRKWLKDWLDPKMFGAWLIGGMLAAGPALLTGCNTAAQRPPSPTEQKYFDVATNFVPVVVLVTNTPAPVTDEATGITTVPAVKVEAVTNTVEEYTFTPNTNAQLTASTGAAVGNIWGVGAPVGGGILGLFTLWGLWRSRKSAIATSAELAQIIETGRQMMLLLPDGAKYEAAYKNWLVKHQADAQVISQVSQLVAASVNKDAAKGAAQALVNLIEATKPK